MHPTKPSISISISGNTVLKEPIISSIGEVTIWVIRSDGVSTPSGGGDTQLLDVSCRLGEVDAVDEWVDGFLHALHDAGVVDSGELVRESRVSCSDGEVSWSEVGGQVQVGDGPRGGIRRGVSSVAVDFDGLLSPIGKRVPSI